MDARKNELEHALHDKGWDVKKGVDIDCSHVCDEVWIIESEWSPRGVALELHWDLFDPGIADPLAKFSGYELASVRTFVLCGEERERGPEMDLRHWPRNLERFLLDLSKLRDQLSQA